MLRLCQGGDGRDSRGYHGQAAGRSCRGGGEDCGPGDQGRGEGVLGGGSAGGGFPLRIPIGSDAVRVMRSKCEDTLESLKEWEVLASSTDFEDTPDVPRYFR